MLIGLGISDHLNGDLVAFFVGYFVIYYTAMRVANSDYLFSLVRRGVEDNERCSYSVRHFGRYVIVILLSAKRIYLPRYLTARKVSESVGYRHRLAVNGPRVLKCLAYRATAEYIVELIEEYALPRVIYLVFGIFFTDESLCER